MREHSVVKVVRLHAETRHFDGTCGVKRPPRVGDIGAVVHWGGGKAIVECVDEEGYTIWLADFDPTELEEA